ncbi:hypothetical protein O3S80_18690 [Streptomyces sp. Lzd4kr]|nr:hypothetical protein [Streptomyces sp. Lzd4kr]
MSAAALATLGSTLGPAHAQPALAHDDAHVTASLPDVLWISPPPRQGLGEEAGAET